MSVGHKRSAPAAPIPFGDRQQPNVLGGGGNLREMIENAEGIEHAVVFAEMVALAARAHEIGQLP